MLCRCSVLLSFIYVLQCFQRYIKTAAGKLMAGIHAVRYSVSLCNFPFHITGRERKMPELFRSGINKSVCGVPVF